MADHKNPGLLRNLHEKRARDQNLAAFPYPKARRCEGHILTFFADKCFRVAALCGLLAISDP